MGLALVLGKFYIFINEIKADNDFFMRNFSSNYKVGML